MRRRFPVARVASRNMPGAWRTSERSWISSRARNARGRRTTIPRPCTTTAKCGGSSCNTGAPRAATNGRTGVRRRWDAMGSTVGERTPGIRASRTAPISWSRSTEGKTRLEIHLAHVGLVRRPDALSSTVIPPGAGDLSAARVDVCCALRRRAACARPCSQGLRSVKSGNGQQKVGKAALAAA